MSGRRATGAAEPVADAAPPPPKVRLLPAMMGMIGAVADYAGWRGVRASALVAGAALVDSAGLLMLIPILNLVVASARGTVQSGFASQWLARLGAETAMAQLAVLLGAFLAITILRAVILYGRDVALSRLQSGFVEAERNRAMLSLAGAPWSAVVGLRHARVTNLITTEIGRLTTASYFMIQGIVLVAMLVIQTGVAFWLSPGLAAVATVLLLLGGGVFLVTQRATHALGMGVVNASQAMMASTGGFLSGLKTAVAQRAQRSFVAEFQSIQRNIRDYQVEFQRRQAKGKLVFGIVSGVLGAGVVLIGFGLLKLRPEILITLVLVFGRMSGPAMQLYQAAQNFVFALPSFEAVRSLEAQLTEAADEEGAEAMPPPPGPIELIGASYVHASGRGVQDVTLTIPAGAFVGFAGPSGAGKTTLIDMIVGLLTPQSGEVRVGGEPLEGGFRKGWAQAIAYVSQEGFLFHDTVRRNLAWSNPEATDAEIAEALEFAGATALVAKMDHGLETVVGERGTLLSGGERQRIGLARALLRNARLLVLDEAANAIDAPGEAALLDRLAALDPRPTILMISHREESLKWCDHIIRVEAGRVVE